MSQIVSSLPLLQKSLGLQDNRLFQKLWDQALACKRISSVETALEGLRETLVYVGKGVRVKGSSIGNQVCSVVKYLLGQQDEFPLCSVDKKFLKAVFFKEDAELLREMRDEIRGVLQTCLSEAPLANAGQEKLLETFIGHVIALIPYTYPEEHEIFNIPVKVNGSWKMVLYKVDKKFEMTPSWFSSSIVAYGLAPLTAGKGPPLLSFLGTTFPAGQGYVATVLSDFTPLMSVGHAPYLMGKESLQKWIHSQSGLQVYGLSLGGALAFHTLRHHFDKIAQVHAYNPAGLYSWDWGNQRFDTGPKVEVYYQENDLVPTMGVFPSGKNVSVYRVFRPEVANPIKAHTFAYTGGGSVMLLKSDADYENSRLVRKLLTTLHFLTGATLLSAASLAVFGMIQKAVSQVVWV